MNHIMYVCAIFICMLLKTYNMVICYENPDLAFDLLRKKITPVLS